MECQQQCKQNVECQFFNWNSKSKSCYLRSNLVNGAASLTQTKKSVVGANDCTNFQIIWPEIYPNPGALTGVIIPEIIPSTESPRSISSSMTTSFVESRSQQPKQDIPGLVTSVPDTEFKTADSNPSSPSQR